jgi:lipopolysaccharide/colanic/teichoic acid biosynthesis glycosyltransferase
MDYIFIDHPRVLQGRTIYRFAKRWVDVILCLLCLPVALPVMAVCACAIYLDKFGPIFFVQERIGKGGRPFHMYKFCTMRPDKNDRQNRAFMKAYIRGELASEENSRKTFKPVQAQQISKVGSFLRKTSLDELPQLFNVLKGEMSLVGPRPNVIWEVEEYSPWHHERMEVLPGMTGLAQVRGRSCIDFNTLVRLDIAYIENQSMTLDMKIIWWTLFSTILSKGAE